ncbi:hypothetical protein EJ02DRAFT_485572, partial [Clathrospora elynae]
LHSLQTQNELVHFENDSLRSVLSTKTKHKKKGKTLDLQQRQDNHGGAVFWSPRKHREAKARDAVKQHEAEQEKLQKSETRELKAAATLYKKKMAEEAKTLRQIAKERREKEKKARAEELAAARALKKQQRKATTSQKSCNTPKKAKRTASHSAAPKNTKRRCFVGSGSRADTAPAPPSPPPKTTTRGRQIKVPTRFK